MTEFYIMVLCYNLGSIPTAFILVRQLKGIDIREVGSGNVGASNAGRVLGKLGFITVLLIDTLKGFIPVFLLMHWYGESDYVLLGAIAVIFGHTFTIFLNFKGGKGVATGLGVFIALAPLSTLIAAGVFVLLIIPFRMISLSSMAAAVTIGISNWFLYDWMNLKYFTIMIVILIINLHRSNITRIMNGTENKVGKKSA
ncbi:MAG: acyl-phosphate glycerol 3-phosphate acyltransferase [Denitrovibrio sp.]|nr:MAG: acyl-phosphate glycerol 3-phosphate acyltransferase [Denitrovibrio sp.]